MQIDHYHIETRPKTERKHFSRVRTARLLTREGSFIALPLSQNPLRGTTLLHPLHGTPFHGTPFHGIPFMTPPTMALNPSQTGVKSLPCPKLSLRAVEIKKTQFK